MKSKSKDEILSAFEKALSSIDAKEDLEYNSRMIMFRFLSEVERVSEEKKINRKELAALIGTSPSYITQLFRGNKLINIETIAKFQNVFDFTFEIKAKPNKVEIAFNEMNVEKISETQNNIQGFWAFHKFIPTYGDQPDQNLTKKIIPEKISA
jgi:transcriptional regulator with XRE-family HTH domain